jgi:CubicO group peptidase (beta-lactamase class C family)
VSAAVFIDGRVRWVHGWGVADIESGRPVDPRTLFQAASISKPVTSAAVLALVSQRRVSVDADVNTVLTTWKVPANEHTAAAPVTLRRLLTHSAGTTIHGFPGYASGEPVPTLLQLLDGLPPAISPPVRVDIPVGSQWRYSGGGFLIVQLLVETVTKKPFADALRELVLQAFGMTSNTFVQPLPRELRQRRQPDISRAAT